MNYLEINIDNINTIIKNKIPNSYQLYFLDSKIWRPRNYETEEKFLKILSALANNDCRTVIVGIKTFKNRAIAIDDFIIEPDCEFRIRSLILSNIFPQITDLKIKILDTQNNKGLIIISFSPTNKPYMFKDGRYYSLYNNKLYFMKENEVRVLYNIQHKPEIELVGFINTQGIPLLENGQPIEINFYPKLLIRNSGISVEKEYKVDIYIPASLTDTEFSPLQIYFNRLDGIFSVFSIPSKTSLFQQEIYSIAELKLKLNRENINDFIDSFIKIVVYFSCGRKEYMFKITELFTYEKKLITNNIFEL